jgi:hypothetical protein
MNSRKKGTRLVRQMRSHVDILIAENSIQFRNGINDEYESSTEDLFNDLYFCAHR